MFEEVKEVLKCILKPDSVFMLPDNYKGDQLQCENHGEGKSMFAVIFYCNIISALSDVCVQSKQRILQTFHHLLTLQTTF